jgi:hypothetical protein
MKLKKFAEAMISQCLEDLYEPGLMLKSVDFFASEEFHMVATMAEMDSRDRINLLRMVNNIIKCISKNASSLEPKQVGRAKNLPLSPACSSQPAIPY